MKTAIKPALKPKIFCNSNGYIVPREKETRITDFKFYQKLFIVLISLSIFLIFSESPRDLENICESYNSKKICNVW